MTKSKIKKGFKVFGVIMGAFLFLISCVIIFFNVTHEYHTIIGDSMYPTLNNGQQDTVFMSKIKSYTHGDIIIATKDITDSQGNEVYVIKRVIAMAGDRISVKLVNGEYRIVLIYSGTTETSVLDEPYLNDYSVNIKLYENFYNMYLNFKKENDNDGFLTIGQDEIFFVGDNRNVSNDCSIYGPKKVTSVCGKVDYIIYGKKTPYIQVLKQFFGW